LTSGKRATGSPRGGSSGEFSLVKKAFSFREVWIAGIGFTGALMAFSSFNSFNEAHKEDVLRGIEKAKGFIRTLLSKRLKIKRVPELVFKQDTSELFL